MSNGAATSDLSCLPTESQEGYPMRTPNSRWLRLHFRRNALMKFPGVSSVIFWIFRKPLRPLHLTLTSVSVHARTPKLHGVADSAFPDSSVASRSTEVPALTATGVQFRVYGRWIIAGLLGMTWFLIAESGMTGFRLPIRAAFAALDV